MKKTGIFYGSSTGITQEVAHEIAKALSVPEADIHNVAQSAPSDVADYDVLIFGSSTWGAGELQDDWYDFLDGLSGMDLKGKTVAVFGCGDESMADTFCNAVGRIYDEVSATGATMTGAFPADCFDINHSDAIREGHGIGLLLDQVNHEDLTPGRINGWAAEIKKQI